MDYEESVRRRVQRELGYELPDDRWKFLITGAIPTDSTLSKASEEDEKSDAREIVKKERHLYAFLRERDGNSQHAPISGLRVPTSRRLLTDHEKQRSRVLSRLTSRQAEYGEGVSLFRILYLGGKLLTDAEAVSFMRSPANAYLTAEEMQAQGIPFIGHTAEVVGRDCSLQTVPRRFLGEHKSRFHFEVTLLVTPPGTTIRVRFRSRESSFYCGLGSCLLDSLSFTPDRSNLGSVESVEVRSGSVLDELRLICEYLAERHYWYDKTIPGFVLSGVQPLLAPIQFRHDTSTYFHGTVKLEAPIWVTAETVKQHFSLMQRALLKHRHRSISDRMLELFQFVQERGEPLKNARGGWDKLWLEWNSSHPEKRYGTVRQFRRDYKERARKPLIGNPFAND
jgi:hypothetical protein